MKVTIKINNQDIEAEIKDEDVAKIVKPKKKLRPELGETYYILYSDTEIVTGLWSDSGGDRKNWSSGNGFFTEAEAEKELAKRQAIQRIKDYIVENDMEFEPDWNDVDQAKYIPYYNEYAKKLECRGFCTLQYYTPFSYLGKVNHLEQLNKDCQGDLLIIFDKK